MNSTDIIGWAYDSALYCESCGGKLPETDSEGNARHPVFADSETDYYSACDGCGVLIPEVLTSQGIEDACDSLRAYLTHRKGNLDWLVQVAAQLDDMALEPYDAALPRLVLESAGLAGRG